MTEKIAKAVIQCSFSFTEGREAEGFSAYDLMRHWAHMEATYADKDKTIFLDDQDLVSTERWYDLPQLRITIPGRDEPYITTKEDEDLFRFSEPKRINSSAFARYVLERFGVTYDVEVNHG